MTSNDFPETDPVLIEELHIALRRTINVIVVPSESGPELNELPLSQVRCLFRIYDRQGQKLVDLAKEMTASLPSLSRTVDRLVKKGLVDRRPDPDDRRAIRLETTEQARILIEQARAARGARLARSTQGLTEEQIRQITASLDLLTSSAERAQE